MISVVVPTYNDAHFLPTALASCLAQTIPVEIVLVDDGSTTPLSEEVSRFIAQHRDIVTHVRHAWNCGLSAARNTGIAHARFDLIIPLDADDWFKPGALAPLASALTDEVDIAYGNVFDSGALYEPVKRPLRRADFLEDTPLFCSSLFRKTVWQAVGGYTVRPGPHYEDWNFWAKAFKAGFRFHYAPITVYEHRSRADSMLRHLHHERARYVRIATEPLLETNVPAEVSAPAESAVPVPNAAHSVTARLRDFVDLPVPNERANVVLRALAGEPCPELAAEHGLDPDDLRLSVRRFVEHGARALAPGERRPPDLLLAHARIGQLLIQLEQAKARTVDARASQTSPELVSAHAHIGRLLIELEQTKARWVDARASQTSSELVSADATIGRLLLQRRSAVARPASEAAHASVQEARRRDVEPAASALPGPCKRPVRRRPPASLPDHGGGS